MYIVHILEKPLKTLVLSIERSFLKTVVKKRKFAFKYVVENNQCAKWIETIWYPVVNDMIFHSVGSLGGWQFLISLS